MLVAAVFREWNGFGWRAEEGRVVCHDDDGSLLGVNVLTPVSPAPEIRIPMPRIFTPELPMNDCGIRILKTRRSR